VKRVLAAAFVLSVVIATIYGLVATRREGDYRRLVERGEAALAREDTATAIAAFSGAIVRKDDSMLGYLKRGETYRRRNELDLALPDLRRAAELDPLAPRPLELLGDVNFTLKRYARAVEHYGRCVSLDDRSPRVLYKLALAQYSAAQPAAAAETLRRAVQINDGFTQAYYLLGLCYRNLQKPEESLNALARAVKLAPSLLQAHEELGDLYDRLGRSDDRIGQLEALLRLDPGPSREVALGLAYARAGQAQKAVRTLGRATDRYPDDPYAYVALGRLWLERAQSSGDHVDLGKALGALEKAVANDEGSEALTQYGRALSLARDDERAEQTLQRATERLPVDPQAFYFLAEAAQRLSHLAVARRALLDYHALVGDDSDPRAAAAFALRVADLSLRTGDAVRAVGWFERAIGSSDTDASILTRLAEAQFLSGATDAARVTLTRALEKDPANRSTQDLMRRLK
jgi:tetratricopeptide (TPR) repeat protein